MGMSQEVAMLVAALVLGAVLLQLLTRSRAAPLVPPTVAPMAHPLDDDVRTLKHRMNNLEQIIQSQTERVAKQEATLAEMSANQRQMLGGMQRMERQLDMLVESGLREGRP